MNAGYLYVLINASLPGLVKIGRTQRAPTHRAAEISSATGVPTPFLVAFEQAFSDCFVAEAYVHQYLAAQGYRTSENREFFNISATDAITALLSTPGRIDSLNEVASIGKDEPAVETTPFWRSLVEEALDHLYGMESRLIDPAKAAKILEKAVEIGGVTAYPILSELYLSGDGVRKDAGYAVSLLKSGIEAGNPYCAWRLGVLYTLSASEKDNSYLTSQHLVNAEKCFFKWFEALSQAGDLISEKVWWSDSIIGQIRFDLYQMYESGTLHDYLRPMMVENRSEIILIIIRQRDRAIASGDDKSIDFWQNSLAKYESAEF